MIGSSRLRTGGSVVLCAIFVCVALLTLVRAGIPTSTDVRVHPWRFDPIDPTADFVPARIRPDAPLEVDLVIDEPAPTRAEVFTEHTTGARLDVRFENADSGELLGEVRGHPVAAGGITTIELPALAGVRKLALTLGARDGIVTLRALERSRRGVEVHAANPAISDVALRTYATVPSPWDRLRLAVDRTLLRWPAWNEWLIPAAVLGLILAGGVSCGWCLRAGLASRSSAMSALSTVVVAVVVTAPLLALLLQLR